MSEIYDHIINISKILDIRLYNKPLIYDYKITHMKDNDIVSIIHHMIYKRGNIITYELKIKGKETTYKNIELKTIKQVNDIFCNFIRDSYYDSPILFNNLKKKEDVKFKDFYKKKPSYFYMGLYENNNNEISRIYVRKNREECYNEYLLI